MVRRMSAQQHLYIVETQSSLLSTGGGAHNHRVSLMDMTCMCGKWEANKIPCSHLITVCVKYNHDATEFMDRFYCMSKRYHSYELIFQQLKDRVLKYLGLKNFPSQELVHIQAPIGAKFLKQRSAQKKFVDPSVGSSKRPQVWSTTGDVSDEDMYGDPTAVVAEDGDDEVDVDTAATVHTIVFS
nr:hypothetical protein CFP56_72258 [Quercus suber]